MTAQASSSGNPKRANASGVKNAVISVIDVPSNVRTSSAAARYVPVSGFSANALVSGAATILGAFGVPVRGGRRAWLVIEGLLGLAVGVVVFVWPDLSALGLLYAIGAWAIALGIFESALAFVLPLSGGRSLLIVLGGLLSVAFGVIMFAHPGAGAVALLALIPAFALVTGAMQIAVALELRRVVVELEQRVRPQATAKPVTQG
jgi:uncharacterized membrane protein HdeD (DUF308 family)